MTNDPMKKNSTERSTRDDVDNRFDLFSVNQVTNLLSVIDSLRARVAELESEPTDTEIAEWRNRVIDVPDLRSTGWFKIQRDAIDRAVALMRRRARTETWEATERDRKELSRQIQELSVVLREEFGGLRYDEGSISKAISILREQRQRIADLESQIEDSSKSEPEEPVWVLDTVALERAACDLGRVLSDASVGVGEDYTPQARRIIDGIVVGIHGGIR